MTPIVAVLCCTATSLPSDRMWSVPYSQRNRWGWVCWFFVREQNPDDQEQQRTVLRRRTIDLEQKQTKWMALGCLHGGASLLYSARTYVRAGRGASTEYSSNIQPPLTTTTIRMMLTDLHTWTTRRREELSSRTVIH